MWVTPVWKTSKLLGIFNLLSEQEENEGAVKSRVARRKQMENDGSLSHTVGARQPQVDG